MTNIKNKDSKSLLQEKILVTIKEYCDENNTTFIEVHQCLNRLKDDICDGFIKF